MSWALSAVALVYVQLNVGAVILWLFLLMRWPGLDLALTALMGIVLLAYGTGLALAWLAFLRQRRRFALITAAWIVIIWVLFLAPTWFGAYFAWPFQS